MTTVTASLNRIKISPRKVSIVARMLSDMKISDALNQLKFNQTRAASLLLKLVLSAVSNAENNGKINPDALVVEKFDIGAATSLKRFHARARGRAASIKRRYSNIRVHLKVVN